MEPEKIREYILSSSNFYFYSPNSDVFHTKSCKILLRAKSVESAKYYTTVTKRRRPCKICKPERDWKREPAPQTVLPHLSRTRGRLVNGGKEPVSPKKIVGYCRNSLHPGRLTQEALEKHKCIEKNCTYLTKFTEASYWRQFEATGKEARQRHKEREKTEEAFLSELKERFQEYADESDYEMQIVQVTRKNYNEYFVLYVSENRFADWNCFPLLMNKLRADFPRCRIRLTHVRDVDGHFVTIDEYNRKARK